MRFGLFTGLGNTTWDEVLRLWRHAEATGWDAAAVTDHFMPNTPERTGDMLECWSTLSALAALVPRLGVGTIVVGNTYRHPAVVAKMATNVDIVSGGRLILGLGAGWQQNEHDAYGIDFPSVAERLARLDEACEVIRRLWTRPKADFEGRYYRLADAPLMPKPVQQPHPPLMIGGGGEKRTLRIAAVHADHWNTWGGPETLARKGRILEEHCASVGRDPRAIVRSANMALLISEDAGEAERLAGAIARRMQWDEAFVRDVCLVGSPAALRDALGRLRDAGVDMLWVPTLFLPRDPRPVLDRFMADVAPALR
jgi:F420-dependent oxidoreductase-like protein